jgi:hypothetical protein
MRCLISSNSDDLIHAGSAPRSIVYFALLLTVLCCFDSTAAQAQSRTLPSHGKIKLDSYNQLLRDVHPASQAQANYLQNRLLGVGVKKAERLERWERLDSYRERQLIKELDNYSRVAETLSAGRPTSASGLLKFWVLVSVYGDRAEVYDALASEVPPMTHDDFTATTKYIRALQPSGELEPPPLLLEGAEGLDATKFQSAWSSLVKDLHATGRISASQAAGFRKCVADYCIHGDRAMRADMPIGGRLQAKKYLQSLGSLADAVYRPQQRDQIAQFVEQQGFGYYGDNMLGFIQHMLKNRITPAQGSTAQLALAEVARPINRVLEQEMAIHFERIDSLATGEGHRPYAAEYRHHDNSFSAAPAIEISQASPPGDVKL